MLTPKGIGCFESIYSHLYILQQRLSHYFLDLDISRYDWMRNPFIHSAKKTTIFKNLVAKEKLLELSMNRSLKLKNNESDFSSFWISIRDEYLDISQQAINILLPFATTFLCKSAFSSLTLIKNKQRSELESVEQELSVLVRHSPRIKSICARMQVHHSH